MNININPVLLQLGHFEVRWYSIVIILAIISAVLIGFFRFKRRGIKPDEVFSLLPWLLIGGLIGARLFHVIDRWEYYSGEPLSIFQIQQGGLAIYGGIVGGAIATIIFGKIKHLPLGRLADALVPGLLVAQVIGRFGCIINGDAYGGPTTLPWGFIYTHPGAMIPADLAGIPTHPYPVYEQIWNIIGLVLVWRLERHLNKDGLLFIGYLAFYSVGRFILTFVREEKIWFAGLQEAQVLAIALLVLSGILLIHRLKTPGVQGA